MLVPGSKRAPQTGQGRWLLTLPTTAVGKRALTGPVWDLTELCLQQWKCGEFTELCTSFPSVVSKNAAFGRGQGRKRGGNPPFLWLLETACFVGCSSGFNGLTPCCSQTNARPSTQHRGMGTAFSGDRPPLCSQQQGHVASRKAPLAKRGLALPSPKKWVQKN